MVPIRYDRVHKFNNVLELMKYKATDLSKLIGKKIINIWVVWDLNNNEWYSDCPVVLELDDISILVDNYETNCMDLGWDAVNINKEIYEFDYEYKIKLQWTNKYEILDRFKGAIIEDIYCEEYHNFQRVLYSKTNLKSVGRKLENWSLSGLGLKTNIGYISIYNGLDQNSIGFEQYRNRDEYRYTSCSIY